MTGCANILQLGLIAFFAVVSRKKLIPTFPKSFRYVLCRYGSTRTNSAPVALSKVIPSNEILVTSWALKAELSISIFVSVKQLISMLSKTSFYILVCQPFRHLLNHLIPLLNYSVIYLL
jgi:hypothetical protein